MLNQLLRQELQENRKQGIFVNRLRQEIGKSRRLANRLCRSAIFGSKHHNRRMLIRVIVQRLHDCQNIQAIDNRHRMVKEYHVVMVTPELFNRLHTVRNRIEAGQCFFYKSAHHAQIHGHIVNGQNRCIRCKEMNGLVFGHMHEFVVPRLKITHQLVFDDFLRDCNFDNRKPIRNMATPDCTAESAHQHLDKRQRSPRPADARIRHINHQVNLLSTFFTVFVFGPAVTNLNNVCTVDDQAFCVEQDITYNLPQARFIAFKLSRNRRIDQQFELHRLFAVTGSTVAITEDRKQVVFLDRNFKAVRADFVHVQNIVRKQKQFLARSAHFRNVFLERRISRFPQDNRAHIQDIHRRIANILAHGIHHAQAIQFVAYQMSLQVRFPIPANQEESNSKARQEQQHQESDNPEHQER